MVGLRRSGVDDPFGVTERLRRLHYAPSKGPIMVFLGPLYRDTMIV